MLEAKPKARSLPHEYAIAATVVRAGALEAGAGSAPGQPLLEEMHEVFRFPSISTSTALQALFRDGDTSEENRALANAGIDAVSLALGALPPADAEAALAALRDSPHVRLHEDAED